MSITNVNISGPGERPGYATSGSACCDISLNEDSVTIPPGESRLVSTGVFMEIPEGYECQIRSRSGLAAKNSIFVLNGVGTIDSDYRGELKVILANFGEEYFSAKKGDRIAQLSFSPVTYATFTSVQELNDTRRGKGGFGSTGL